MSVAERLYYEAQEMLEFAAEVVDIRLESRRDGVNRWQVALDRTAFYPESGGQPWDTGRLEAVAKSGARLEVPVLSVIEEDGEIWHLVEKPMSAGTVVTGLVDGARRRDHMQQHTGQHLLSAVFLSEFKAQTISFHLGESTSTIDLDVAELGREEAVRAEQRVNDLIREARRVSVGTVERQVAEDMIAKGELRKLPERVGAIRVVEIEGVEMNACGGTHVGSTGCIGGLMVRKIEKVRRGVRVEFCCGLRAVRAARRDFETVGELSRLLSTGAAEVGGKVAGLLEDVRAGTKARRELLEEVAGLEARSWTGERVAVRARNVEYAKLLAAKFVEQKITGIVIVQTCEEEKGTVVLAAGGESGVDCGAVMKKALEEMGARGGGAKGMAQGGVALEQTDGLVKLLQAQLPKWVMEPEATVIR